MSSKDPNSKRVQNHGTSNSKNSKTINSQNSDSMDSKNLGSESSQKYKGIKSWKLDSDVPMKGIQRIIIKKYHIKKIFMIEKGAMRPNSHIIRSITKMTVNGLRNPRNIQDLENMIKPVQLIIGLKIITTQNMMETGIKDNFKFKISTNRDILAPQAPRMKNTPMNMVSLICITKTIALTISTIPEHLDIIVIE